MVLRRTGVALLEYQNINLGYQFMLENESAVFDGDDLQVQVSHCFIYAP